MKTKNNKNNISNFLLFNKLSIAFGALFIFVVMIWCLLLILELTEALILFNTPGLEYFYYVLFVLTSLSAPAWICMSAGSAIESISFKKIDTYKYKINVLVSSIISFLLVAIGTIIIVMGVIPGIEDITNTNWNLIIVGTLLLVISIAAIIYGLVIAILAYKKVNQ